MDKERDPIAETAMPIVIIAGPPGAGKSTVARELVATSPWPSAYIEGDLFWSFFVNGSDEPERHGDFRTIMRAMTGAAVPYALAGYETILDFSIPPWYLNGIRKIAGLRNVEVHYVVLRPSKVVCAARAAGRAEGPIARYELFDDFYDSFDEASAHMIADDVSSASVLAEKVRSGLNAGMFRLGMTARASGA
jgi:tRNA uridine 5-carbamoylmethylation protein Kti12